MRNPTEGKTVITGGSHVYGKILLVAGLLLLVLTVGIAMKDWAVPDSWHLADVTGHLPDLQFSLIADTGRPVTERDFRGNIVLLYFGFTQCPDQCPLTLGRISSVLRQLGKDANNLRFLFVTVDPLHDTPQKLSDYLKAFSTQHVIGLTGKESAIAELTRRYHAAYTPSGANASPMHGDAIYIFDAQGHARLLAINSDTDSAMAEDLRQLTHVIAH